MTPTESALSHGFDMCRMAIGAGAQSPRPAAALSQSTRRAAGTGVDRSLQPWNATGLPPS
jgi:hypothetical protein